MYIFRVCKKIKSQALYMLSKLTMESTIIIICKKIFAFIYFNLKNKVNIIKFNDKYI